VHKAAVVAVAPNAAPTTKQTETAKPTRPGGTEELKNRLKRTARAIKTNTPENEKHKNKTNKAASSPVRKRGKEPPPTQQQTIWTQSTWRNYLTTLMKITCWKMKKKT
jgi:hypothetical protein